MFLPSLLLLTRSCKAFRRFFALSTPEIVKALTLLTYYNNAKERCQGPITGRVSHSRDCRLPRQWVQAKSVLHSPKNKQGLRGRLLGLQ